MLSRTIHKFVGIGSVEVDLLALYSRIRLVLNLEDGLRATGGHLAVGAEDGHLVFQGGYIEVFVAGVVVGRHLGRDLFGAVSVHPLHCLDVRTDQLLNGVFVIGDIVAVHEEADEGVRTTKSGLGALWRAHIDQDFADAS